MDIRVFGVGERVISLGVLGVGGSYMAFYLFKGRGDGDVGFFRSSREDLRQGDSRVRESCPVVIDLGDSSMSSCSSNEVSDSDIFGSDPDTVGGSGGGSRSYRWR
jgi:hypothetical protein